MNKKKPTRPDSAVRKLKRNRLIHKSVSSQKKKDIDSNNFDQQLSVLNIDVNNKRQARMRNDSSAEESAVAANRRSSGKERKKKGAKMIDRWRDGNSDNDSRLLAIEHGSIEDKHTKSISAFSHIDSFKASDRQLSLRFSETLRDKMLNVTGTRRINTQKQEKLNNYLNATGSNEADGLNNETMISAAVNSTKGFMDNDDDIIDLRGDTGMLGLCMADEIDDKGVRFADKEDLIDADDITQYNESVRSQVGKSIAQSLMQRLGVKKRKNQKVEPKRVLFDKQSQLKGAPPVIIDAD